MKEENTETEDNVNMQSNKQDKIPNSKKQDVIFYTLSSQSFLNAKIVSIKISRNNNRRLFYQA